MHNLISSKFVSFVSHDFTCLLYLHHNGSPLQSEEGRMANKSKSWDFLHATATASCSQASNEGAVRPTHIQASVLRLDVANPPPYKQRKKNRKEAPFQAQHITGNIGNHSWKAERQTRASCVCLLTSTTDRKEVSLLQTLLVISWEHHLQLFQTPLVAHLNLMGHWVPLPFTREVLGGSRICVARKRPYCTQWGRKGTADLQLSQPVCLRRVCCNVLLKSFGWALFLRK